MNTSRAASPVIEKNVAGKRFKFKSADRSSPRMTLRSDHRIEGAPSIHEHSWEIEAGRLILRHRNGQRTIEFVAQNTQRYIGSDLTQSPPGRAELKLDWRARFPITSDLLRRIRHVLNAEKQPQKILSLHQMLAENSIGLRFEHKKIRWIFVNPADMRFFQKVLLPWVFPDFDLIGSEQAVDFVVGVYLNDETIRSTFAELPGQKFLLSCEKETRHPRVANCHSFVQNPLPDDDHTYIRYAPTFCCHSPPRDEEKTGKCSVVDSGQYVWRKQMIQELSARIGGVDVFGKLSGRPLAGYHNKGRNNLGNDKYLGIERYCFYLSLERAIADDYITEKLTDAIFCNAVPIYDGAPNIGQYALPGSYIPASEIDKVDWNNWRQEYQKRLPILKAQKELIRAKFNLFSYFNLLTQDLSLLSSTRPISL